MGKVEIEIIFGSQKGAKVFTDPVTAETLIKMKRAKKVTKKKEVK